MRVLAACLALVACSQAQTDQGDREAACEESTEVRAICEADRRDRKSKPVDWNLAGARDPERRHRVSRLLANGGLACPDDWYRAALIFQHGFAPDDYLLAHILASAAAFEGHEPARRLAAATLDRHLGRVGQPQVFGTQRRKMLWDSKFSQAPFNRELVPPEVRAIFGLKLAAEARTGAGRSGDSGSPQGAWVRLRELRSRTGPRKPASPPSSGWRAAWRPRAR